MRSKHSLMEIMLIVAGILLILLGFVFMLGVGDELQYVLPVSFVDEKGDGLTKNYDQLQRQLENMAGMLDASTVAARAQGYGVQHVSNGGRVEATVYAVGEGYFDLKHSRLLEGRLIAPYDIVHAQQVVMLDSGVALRLFQSESPIGQIVMLENEPFRVVGMVEGGRHIGETGEYTVFVPITVANTMKMDTLEITAKGSGVATAAFFESTLRSWNNKGSFHYFEKLKMGAWLPLRWALVLLAVRMVMLFGTGIVRYAQNSVWVYRERLMRSYVGSLMPRMMGRGVFGIMLVAVLAVMIYGIALATTQPLYKFGEWVPDVFVDLSSLIETFWNLNDSNAAGIRCMSREACLIELSQGLIRWGTGCMLLGMAYPMRAIRVKRHHR